MSQTEKIDILDRTKIMSDIEQILVLLSEQKQGRVFALDGKCPFFSPPFPHILPHTEGRDKQTERSTYDRVNQN